MSEGFSVSRGVRQGFPLSPCIFVIAVELLAIAVRHNVKIKGIKENGVEKNSSICRWHSFNNSC